MEKITDQSPVIRISQSHHRRAKAWAALQGLSLREAIGMLIDQAYPQGLAKIERDKAHQLRDGEG